MPREELVKFHRKHLFYFETWNFQFATHWEKHINEREKNKVLYQLIKNKKFKAQFI